MWHLLAAPLAAAARDVLGKGVAALVWGGVVFGLLLTGLGLLLAAALIGLSMLIGPLLASGLLGLALILLALLIILLRRGNRLPEAHPTPLATPVPPPPAAPPLNQLAFMLGFVLARTFVQDPVRGPKA